VNQKQYLIYTTEKDIIVQINYLIEYSQSFIDIEFAARLLSFSFANIANVRDIRHAVSKDYLIILCGSY